MKKKNILIIIVAFVLVFSLNTISKAEEKPIKIIMNGEVIESDVPPFLENGRTMVPLRVITEAFGYKVEWFEETQEIWIDYSNGQPSGDIISLTIGDDKIFINETQYVITDVAPKLKNGRTFVPLRVIAELFVMDVNWNEKEWIVSLNDKIIDEEFPIYWRLGEVSLMGLNSAGVSSLSEIDTTVEISNYIVGQNNELNKILEELIVYLTMNYGVTNSYEFYEEFKTKREEYATNIVEKSEGNSTIIEYNTALSDYTFETIKSLSKEYLNIDVYKIYSLH